jgi:hypothetical protein
VEQVWLAASAADAGHEYSEFPPPSDRGCLEFPFTVRTQGNHQNARESPEETQIWGVRMVIPKVALRPPGSKKRSSPRASAHCRCAHLSASRLRKFDGRELIRCTPPTEDRERAESCLVDEPT